KDQGPRAIIVGLWSFVFGRSALDICPVAAIYLADVDAISCRAALSLAGLPGTAPVCGVGTRADCRLQIADCRLAKLEISNLQSAMLASALTCLAIAGIMLLHRPYVGEAWMLARKHAQLWRADRALAGGDAAGATAAAEAALVLDPDSALGRVALARAALIYG